MSEMMTTNMLVKMKEAPPYTVELETPVLLNSLARASPDKKTGSYTFKQSQPTEVKPNLANVGAIEETLKFSGSTVGVGVDQGIFLPLPWELTQLTVLRRIDIFCTRREPDIRRAQLH
jgi:hypothetical protein